jgi:hypothetical protein
MDYKYLRLIPLISAISLGGCELTDSDKKKLDKAGENLEKVALAPTINSPGESATIFDVTDIRIGTDTTVPHASVSLLIDGQKIATDNEAPFEFSWDPYFWSKDKQGALSAEEQIEAQVATISVTALTEGEAFLRSDVRNIKLSDTLKDSISFTAPASNQDFQNTNQVNIAWTPRASAVKYEYQVNNEDVITTVDTHAALTLENTGGYQLKVRATNDLGFTGAWSSPLSFNIVTPDAPAFNSVSAQVDNGWQVNFSWENASLSSELQVASDQAFNKVIDTLSSTTQTISQNYPDGNYFVRARTTNEYSHTSSWSNVKAFTINNTIAIISPTSNQSFQNKSSIDLAWTSRPGAISYEYQLNNEPAVSINNTLTTLNVNSIATYSVKARAINNLGYTGTWSATHTFNLNIPNSPVLNKPTASNSENGLEASFSWTGAQISSELQIATDQGFNSIVDTLPTNALTITESLPAGIYYARVRTTNEFGHVSLWSTVKEINMGLFAHKIDMATYGWDTTDRPIDFEINEDNAVILATASDHGDASGDQFYLSKVGFDGETKWDAWFGNISSYAKAISKTEDGYLLLGSAKNYSGYTIFEANEAGTKLWQETIPNEIDLDASTRTRELIDGAVQLSDNTYAFINTTYNYTITGPQESWGGYPSTLDNKEFKVSILDRSTEPAQITSHIISNPGNGSYDYLNKLLLTDSGLYAAGRYTASNDTGPDSSADSYTASDSGAFLVTMDKADGSITSHKTGGGISEANVSNLIELTNGDITVSYNSYYTGASTTFASNANTSISKLDNTIKNSKIASEPNGGYFMVGTSKTNDKKSIISRYNAENQRISGPHTFNSCFYDLDITSIKYHPDYGLIALGTDGTKYSNKYTVLFNITDDFDYLCPTTKN